MNIKKLRRVLTKEIRENWPDGYLRLDAISVLFDETDGRKSLIKVNGAYGRYDTDGNVAWQKEFTLYYANGKSTDYVAGMLGQLILES